MQAEPQIRFGPYRFAPHTGQLWRSKQEVRLTPKVAAVLRYLVEQAGQVVTKEELFAVAWPDTVVSDASLTTCVQEIRQALHDNARHPRYIETVHRRGFRFLGKVVSSQHSVVSSPPPLPQHLVLSPQHSVLVGRETDLAFLQERLARALSGERQLVFVTGEAGIGKTSLLEAFVVGVRDQEESQKSKRKSQNSKIRVSSLAPNPQPLAPKVWVGGGQCIEHYGAGEAYLPILEALGRLCREPGGEHLIELLSRHAPSWLVQMPALLNAVELETLQRKTAGGTRERMLRELAEALEVVVQGQPLVLVLEDLHWSDVSTLDLLSMLARRQEPARLLVIGTYRPVEVLTRDHPLKGVKQELRLHGQCEELALDFLSEAAIGEYLTQRLSALSPALAGEARGEGLSKASFQRLAYLIHRRTDGNPLFMVNVTNELIAHGVETRDLASLQSLEKLGIGVPENLRQLIEQQLARVSTDERKILEAASVAGAEFSAAAVAAGVETTVETVEEHCEELTRREQFLRTSGAVDWPDGTVTARYNFLHVLYQDVLYTRLSARRQQRLHQQIGEREEQSYGERAREIATELAVHFERGRDYRKAIRYLQYAGENALRRSAYQEAISLLTKGLELLNTLPDTSERAQQELLLLKILGPLLISLKGYAAVEVEHTYARAYELCHQSGNPRQLIGVLHGLQAFYLVRGEVRKARDLAEQAFQLAQSVATPTALMAAYGALGMSLHHLGELTTAREHLEQAWALYNPQEHNPRVTRSWGNPGVLYLSYIAMTLWWLGYPDQALEKARAALLLAHDVAHPYSLTFALTRVAALHFYRGETQLSQEYVEALIALATDQGFPDVLALETARQGIGRVAQGEVETGIAQLRHGLAEMQAIGQEIGRASFLASLATAYGKQGQTNAGLKVMVEALAAVNKTGEQFYEAELYRIKGELLLAQESREQRAGSTEQKSGKLNPNSHILDPQGEAEACFLKAIEVAHKQQAKSLELLATTSLARLWQQQALEQGARSTEQRGKRKEVSAGSKEQESRNTNHASRIRLAEAHKLLSDIYSWFTEGFDTKDLQEAKALLAELS